MPSKVLDELIDLIVNKDAGEIIKNTDFVILAKYKQCEEVYYGLFPVFNNINMSVGTAMWFKTERDALIAFNKLHKESNTISMRVVTFLDNLCGKLFKNKRTD